VNNLGKLPINKVVLNGEELINISTTTAGQEEVLESEEFFLASGVRTKGRLRRGNVHTVSPRPIDKGSIEEMTEALGKGEVGDVYRYVGATEGFYVQNALYIIKET
jgi:hypothetical protein